MPSASSRPARAPRIVSLTLEYEPEGVVEQIGDKLGIVERQVDVRPASGSRSSSRTEGYASGAWRGAVNEGVGVGTPGVEHATASQGDSGKAGVSGVAVAAGAVAAAAGVAAVAAATKSSGGSQEAEAGQPVEVLHVVDTVEVVETSQPMDEWGED